MRNRTEFQSLLRMVSKSPVKRLIAFTFILLGLSSPCFADKPFGFALAGNYRANKHPLSEYLISEKLDGVRAYWDGKQLHSRGGKVFAAPAWFLQALPSEHLDGELWIARNRFDEISGIVRKQQPHAGWKKIRFMVFEMPLTKGSFEERYQTLQELKKKHGNPNWSVVPQNQAPSTPTELKQRLLALVREGGEGFILKHKQAIYRSGRSNDLLKVKLRDDAEAVVLHYNPGKGRLLGMMGSIRVRMSDGVEFNIGSGFSDAERRSPPAIGSTVTFAFNGLTSYGKPRFPVFLRLRQDEPLKPN